MVSSALFGALIRLLLPKMAEYPISGGLIWTLTYNNFKHIFVEVTTLFEKESQQIVNLSDRTLLPQLFQKRSVCLHLKVFFTYCSHRSFSSSAILVLGVREKRERNIPKRKRLPSFRQKMFKLTNILFYTPLLYPISIPSFKPFIQFSTISPYNLTVRQKFFAYERQDEKASSQRNIK
jgi:hypothetical protein